MLQIRVTATGTEDFTIVVRLSATAESGNQFLPRGIQLQVLDETGGVCGQRQTVKDVPWVESDLTGKSGARF